METLDHIIIETAEKLCEPGDSMPIAGHVDLEGYSVGEKQYRLLSGVDYDLVLTHAGDGILATGIVRATSEGECDRCLEAAQFEISSELDEYYLFEAPETVDVDDEDYYDDDSDAFELVGEDNTVDLAGAINDAIVMDTPFVLLCDPDCQGLCPHCGCNLNKETCDCDASEEEDPFENNPFAVLKNLKLDE